MSIKTLQFVMDTVSRLKPGSDTIIPYALLDEIPQITSNAQRDVVWTAADQVLDNIVDAPKSLYFRESPTGMHFYRLAEPLAGDRQSFVSPMDKQLFVQDADGFYSKRI